MRPSFFPFGAITHESLSGFSDVENRISRRPKGPFARRVRREAVRRQARFAKACASILALDSTHCTARFFSGSWASNTAASISTQPRYSFPLIWLPKAMAPATVANTDSRLSSKDTTVGLESF